MLVRERVVIGPDEGDVILSGGIGFVGKLYGDEISYVLEGKIGVMIGDEVYTAPAGSYVLKPRGVPHTFWNPGPERARIIEIFSPAGFERYFEELAEILSAGGPPDIPRLEELASQYGTTFHWEHMEEILRQHNLRLQ